MNILLIMTDQLRLDHVGFCPGTRLATPHIDRIAGSCAFTGCITASPMCQPARAALLTGKYPHQIGMTTMSGDLSPQHPTYPRALQAAGYQTAAFGKLHLLQGWDWFRKIEGNHDLIALNPRMKDFGFDELTEASGKQLVRRDHCHWRRHLDSKGLLPGYFEHLRRCAGNRFAVEEGHLDQVQAWPFEESDCVDVWTADQTMRHLRERERGRPFFIFNSFCGPHVPYDPPARYLAQFADEPADPIVDPDNQLSAASREQIHRMQIAYKAMVRLIDDQVGRILNSLEEEGLMEETLIVFSSDHGEMLGDHGLLQKGYPQWQSLSVPLAIRHPRHLTGLVNDSPVELTDITATLLDAAGLDPRQSLSKSWPSYHDLVPGRSLLPIVRGNATAVREWAFAESDARWHSPESGRTTNWQVVQDRTWQYQRHVRIHDSTPENYLEERLFRRDTDSELLTDLASDPAHRDVLNECRRQRDFIVSTTPPAQIGWAPLVP